MLFECKLHRLRSCNSRPTFRSPPQGARRPSEGRGRAGNVGLPKAAYESVADLWACGGVRSACKRVRRQTREAASFASSLGSGSPYRAAQNYGSAGGGEPAPPGWILCVTGKVCSGRLTCSLPTFGISAERFELVAYPRSKPPAQACTALGEKEGR